jgi:transposase
MYTIRDLQIRFGVSVHTVLGWVNSGELKAINVGVTLGKKKPRWRISADALAAFEAARAPTPATPRGAGRRKQPAGVVEFYK